MGRLTAKDLRQIVVHELEARAREATRVEVEKKTSDEIKRRRERLWQRLHRSAANGKLAETLENLEDGDALFFRQAGLQATRVFARVNSRSYWNSVEKNLRKRLSLLEVDVERRQRNPTGMNLDLLEGWLIRNKAIAFQCSLEKWFGEDLSCVLIETPSDLEGLQDEAQNLLNTSKDQNRTACLRDLIRLIAKIKRAARPSFNLLEAENAINAALSDLEAISINPEYSFPDRIKKIDEITWGDSWVYNKRPITSWSANSLSWLCSDKGQAAIKAFENSVREQAGEGHCYLGVRCYPANSMVAIRAANGSSLSINFISWFDFIKFITPLGFRINPKVACHDEVVTIEW
jgi:hypothetical protein